MGRKNLLDLTLEAHAPAPDATGTSSVPVMASLRDTMRQLGESGIQDLDPTSIEASDLQDRLLIDQESIAELAESIRRHGQQVPVLVRPIPGQFNRYKIVYGRRRLAAVRLLGNGTRVKAIVRSLDDKTAIIAQGQENSLRLDPSFIEKSVFIGAMREAGYDRTVIQEALGLSRQAVSTYTVVLDALPYSVIEAIGPAHDVGRRPWTELAQLARDDGIDLKSIVQSCLGELDLCENSNQRFEIIRKKAVEAKGGRAHSNNGRLVHHGSSTVDLKLGDGRRLGKVRTGPHAVQMQLSLKDHPEFGQWIGSNAERIVRELHERWLDESGQRS